MSTLARELGFLARRSLAQVLDHQSGTGADWRGLVDKMGFSYEMNMLLSSKESPTLSLLEEWERVLGAEATLERLTALVESLGCMEGVDVLMKAKAEKKERLDSKGSISSSNSLSPLSSSPRENRSDSDTYRPLTPHHNSLNVPSNTLHSSSPPHSADNHTTTYGHTSHDSHMTSNGYTQNGVDPYVLSQHMEKLTIDNKLQRSLDSVRNKQFDVFLSFSLADEEFAEELRSRLTTQANMRVFVPSDDLMPGKVFSEQIADMIKSGCRKTIVLLSPDYLQSEWCSYEARMALHESPGMAGVNTGQPILVPGQPSRVNTGQSILVAGQPSRHGRGEYGAAHIGTGSTLQVWTITRHAEIVRDYKNRIYRTPDMIPDYSFESGSSEIT